MQPVSHLPGLRVASARTGLLAAGLMLLGIAFLGGLASSPAHASPGGPPGYPRIMVHTSYSKQLPLDEREMIPWFDMLSTREPPERIAEIRAENPHIRIFHRSMPQFIPTWNEGETYWYADTTWSLLRLVQYYAMQNDWYLHDTAGEPIEGWSGYVSNWTRYCPEGTYGTSVGLTYAEWYVDVALPQIIQHSPAWEPWGWGSSSYDGISWEVMVDCPHCCEEDQFLHADPDRDGLPEGISEYCWNGGDQDSLSILFEETNDDFHDRLMEYADEDLVILINRGGIDTNPEWYTELNGYKMEAWHPRGGWGPTWWNYMYGVRNNGNPMHYGYKFAEDALHPYGNDEREGWDVTYLQVTPRTPEYDDPEFTERMIRWGVGTSMLGDGYFTYSENEFNIDWHPLYDLDFGQPLEDFQREVYYTDTLYVRRFDLGQVEVNPNPYIRHGVLGEDSRFSFWLTVEDLTAELAGPDSVHLVWTEPLGEWNDVDVTEMRMATYPLTAQNWGGAELASGTLIPPEEPGGEVQLILSKLQGDTQYYFAGKNIVHGRPEPNISNVATITTEPVPDPDILPPAGIVDLSAVDVHPTTLTLEWTAPGDDGQEGAADHYEVRYRTGGPILSEADWNSAVPISEDVPTPGSAGTDESMPISGLTPEETYGFAVRAVDEEDNRGALSNPLEVVLPPELPGVLDDLAVINTRPDGFDLAWTASGSDGDEGQATSFILGVLEGRSIDSEQDWDDAQQVSNGLPQPGPAGTTQGFVLSGLEEETSYGLSMRALDEGGHLSPLGPPLLQLTTAAPDTIPPGRIEDLSAEPDTTFITLRWSAPGDDGDEGTANTYLLGVREGGAIESEEDWDLALKTGFQLPAPAPAGTEQSYVINGLLPGTAYGVCLRASDEVQNLSLLSPPLVAETLVPEPGEREVLSPPARIEDLTSSALVGGFLLEWTAPGDDGADGIADHYELAYLEGSAIETEGEWNTATLVPAEQLPAPEPSGTVQTFLLSGLPEDTVFGMAIRAVDEADNRAEHSPALTDTTLTDQSPAEPDLIPPQAVEDLTITQVYEEGFLLEWTTPGDDGGEGTAAFYVLGIREGGAIETEGDWLEASLRTRELPEPVPASGSQWALITGLSPATTYGMALRAYDESANLSPLGAPLTGTTTDPGSTPDEDLIPPAPIDDLLAIEEHTDGFVLTWTAPGDDGESGIAQSYTLAYLPDQAIDDENDWQLATQLTEGLPPAAPAGLPQSYRLRGLAAETLYGLSLRAQDEVGNWGAIGMAHLATTLPESGPDPGGEQDTIPPAAVTGLSVVAVGPSWADLRWLCPGDDDIDGTASSFVLGYLTGDEFAGEDAWENAVKRTEDQPDPLPAGQEVSYRLSGLDPQQAYVVVVRAFDDAGLLSAMGPALAFATIAPPDTIGPGRVTDLAASPGPEGGVLLTWTAAGDDDQSGQAATLVVAYSSAGEIASEALWDVSQQVSHLAPAAGGSDVSLLVEDLQTELTWGFAVRYVDDAGLRGPISNSPTLWLEDPDPDPDSEPPSPVTDLRVCDLGVDWVTLNWTATGDDSTQGRAAQYRLAWLAGDPLTGENWESATATTVPFDPGEAGETESYTLTGLEAGLTYGLGMKVVDEAGNSSLLSNTLTVALTEPHVPTPPEAITDLAVTCAGPSWIEVGWTAPQSYEPSGSVIEYDIGFARQPVTQENWAELLRASDPPAPGSPGAAQSYRLDHLQLEENYWICICSRDGLGNWSPLSNVAFGTTQAEDLLAPVTPTRPIVTPSFGKEDDLIWVSWVASADPDIAGYHLYGRSASQITADRLAEDLILHSAENEIEPGRMGWPIDPPASSEQFYISVAAVDSVGNESPASTEAELFAQGVALEGPYPHPIVVPPGGDPAEFHLSLPATDGGQLEVDLKIYSVTGELVRSRWDSGYPLFPAGAAVLLTWDTCNDRGVRVAPGLYFLKLQALGVSEVKRIYVKRE